MKCYTHPDEEAIGACVECGKGVCEQCGVSVEGRLMCRSCLATGGDSARKRIETAYLLELIGGILGFLGIGYLYAGWTSDGILRLILWWVYLVIAWIVIVVAMAMVIGICLVPVEIAIQAVVAVWSAKALKERMLSGAPPES